MNRFIKSSRRKRKVLVVDDELINRELLEAILSLNYDISCATCGSEAMDMLNSAQEPYSLILLDIIMPQMSGFQVLEACKSDENLKKIPIIVMTSEKSAEVRSIRMGADDFIPKPYRMPEVIIARCERIIELSEEKALIRSIEKDKVSGLYIKLFFDAYINRMLPDLRAIMDAAAIRLDGFTDDMNGTPEGDRILRKTAELISDKLIGSRGLGCRRDDNTFCVFCGHKENYEELIAQMQDELSADTAADIRIKAGIYERIDKSIPIDTWFEQAGAACDSVADGAYCAKYTG